jgi:hypothetical protein
MDFFNDVDWLPEAKYFDFFEVCPLMYASDAKHFTVVVLPLYKCKDSVADNTRPFYWIANRLLLKYCISVFCYVTLPGSHRH